MKNYAVKGFRYEEKQGVIILDEKADLKKPEQYKRIFFTIADNLNWEKAKETRNLYKGFGASIFPSKVKSDNELKVIQL